MAYAAFAPAIIPDRLLVVDFDVRGHDNVQGDTKPTTRILSTHPYRSDLTNTVRYT